MKTPDETAETRTEVLRYRAFKGERATIEAKARAAGLSLSEYQRRACLDAAITPKAPANAEAVRLLLIAGNNVNQLARNMNRGAPIAPVAVRDTLAELRRAIEALVR